MKIGFVFDDTLDTTDGVQQYVIALGAWLSSQGHEVHYLVGQTTRTDIANIHSLSRNVAVRFNGNRLSIPLPASRKRLKALLAKENFDVLHVQVPYSPLLAGRVIKLAGPKTAVIGTFHIAPYSGLVTFATKVLAVWLRSSLKRFDRIVSVSPAAASFTKQTFGLDTEVVPNVFDYARFHNALPLPKYDDDTLTIVFLGRLVNRKGCKKLLEAIKFLESDGTDYPPFRVVVCGGGPLDAELKRYALDNNLSSVVNFVGRISEEDKPKYMASADIAVFPSSGGESFGIVLIEAMASGRAAVLGGDNPGYRSVLGDRPSLLFDAMDSKVLAIKLAALLQDRKLREADALWGEDESSQYDVGTVGATLTAIYTEEFARNSSNKA